VVDLRSPGWGEAQPWVLNINMRPALISERQRVASACRTKRISARPAADKAGGTKQAHNPVQLMPPRFEHEHEHDLVADLGVSSVERSAALRLCGESPSGLGVWGSGFWGSEHNRARARSPFKTPSRQCETGPLSRGSLPPFHPSILPSFHPSILPPFHPSILPPLSLTAFSSSVHVGMSVLSAQDT